MPSKKKLLIVGGGALLMFWGVSRYGRKCSADTLAADGGFSALEAAEMANARGMSSAFVRGLRCLGVLSSAV